MIKQLLSSNGRVGRLYYLSILVFVSLINIIASFLSSRLDCMVMPIACLCLLFFMCILVLAFLAYISIVTAIKRFHDMNMTGWHELIRTFVWILLTFVWILPIARPSAIIIFNILCIIVLFSYGFQLLFDSGTKGPNKFGDTTLTVKDIWRKSAKR